MYNQNEAKNEISKVKITLITIDEGFNYLPFCKLLKDYSQSKISSYHYHRDRVVAFTSQILKELYLADVLGVKDIEIDYTKHFKPFISRPDNLTGKFKFNISHAGNYVVFASYCGEGYDLGVDIEKIDNTLNINEMSEIVFSQKERNLIENSYNNFFKLWTKKESLIKAIGTGFATDFYQDTNLNLDNLEEGIEYIILSKEFEDYYLSICLSKIKE